ncbi:MAG: NAD(P)H-dependent glycerol-3-phosphate dehydrogenase [Planctomycetota bacterium]
MIKRIAVVGDGGWGTAIAVLLNSKNFQVKVWGNFHEYVQIVEKTRENTKFLPNVKIPNKIQFTNEFSDIKDSELIVCAVPTQFIRDVFTRLSNSLKVNVPVVSVSKGIEQKTFLRCTQIITDVLGPLPVAALSGPSHAEEVACGIPTAVVVASENIKLAEKIQDVFICPTFRVYSSNDLIGVELGGALKNIIAIAAGMCDGLGFGDNTKSALLTRGLVEIIRLSVALGARKETLSGLSGIGDLITTSFSKHGRNRAMGELIGNGLTLNDAVKSTEKIAEGVWTTDAVYNLVKKIETEMPITEQVYNVLFNNKPPQKAVIDLMTRGKKRENEELS